MSKKIIGVTVGTPISPAKIMGVLKPVTSVNGAIPDENGNAEVVVPQINVERLEIGNDSGVNISVGTPNGDGGMSWEYATVYDGKPGDAGYTPIKGVDYFTEGDKAELVAAVLAGIPAAEGVEF